MPLVSILERVLARAPGLHSHGCGYVSQLTSPSDALNNVCPKRLYGAVRDVSPIVILNEAKDLW